LTTQDYLNAVETMTYQGNTYGLTGLQETMGTLPIERIRADFAGAAQSIYGGNSAIFSIMAVRQLAFSAIRFQWQRYNKGRPDEMFATPALRGLEQPWPGGTTGDILAKMITDVDLAGNSYWTRQRDELIRMRPDWVDILLEPRMVPTGDQRSLDGVLGYRKIGYLYWEGGRGQAKDPVVLGETEVAHFCPLPDPLATYRGMSWVTAVIRQVCADRDMTSHQIRFLRNSATPNMIIKHDPGVTPADARLFKELLDREYGGPENAGKTMHIGGGADVQVVGVDFKQLDFKSLKGHTETLLAAAAGVPPIVVGFSEGLAASSYSNYNQALRRFSGLTMHPLWQSAAGSLQRIFPPPPGCRLWYDTRDVAFLREDAADLSEIQQNQAATISSYISAGFTPETAVLAVMNDDPALLEHTGLVSVQLWEPGAQPVAGSSDTTKVGGNGSLAGDEPDATPPQEQ
jgi:phage portal protein BeeE